MFKLDPRRECDTIGNAGATGGTPRRRFARQARRNQQRRQSTLELCRRYRRGGSKFGCLLVFAGITAGGVYAYRRFFQRTGELAVKLIPADAQMVVTLDIMPSASQAPTFKRIGDAIKAEHLDTKFDELATRSLANSPLARDLRPLATGSMAFALLKASGGTAQSDSMGGDSVIYMAVKDAGQTTQTLDRDAQKSNVNGLDYYKVAGDTHCMAVIGSYLVTADRPQDLTRVEEVRKGEMQAIAALPDYQTARAGLPADSNLMVFISGDAITQTMRQSLQMAGQQGLASHAPTPQMHYIAVGVAIRDGGIDAMAQIPMDSASVPGLGELAHIAPLDPGIWRKLPGGAYGLFALSQPGKYYNYATGMISGDADARRQMNDSVASFERETGLSVTRDILTGTNGNAVLAVYPDADNPRSSIDGVMVLDDANGADPAALSDRIRGYVERASGQSGQHPLHFTSENRSGVIIWKLDQAAQQDLQHSLAGGVSDAQQSAGIAPTPPPPVAPPASSNSTTLLPPDAASPNYMGHGSPPENGINNNSGGSSSVGNGNNNAPSGNSGTGGNGNGNQSYVDAHIHGDNEGRVYDDSFALHHGDTDIHVDNHGVNVRSGSSHISANENGLDAHIDSSAGHALAGVAGDAQQAANNAVATASNAAAAGAVSALSPDVQRAVGNKTVTWAQVGHAVIIASSPHMLDRALAAYTSGSGALSDDAGFAAMRQRIPAGSQYVTLINLPSILEAVRPLIAQALRGSHTGLTAEDITGLAGGLGNGMVATQQYDGKTMRATYFLPLDYERAIHLAGVMQRQMR